MLFKPRYFSILSQNYMLHVIWGETNLLCIELRNVECTSFIIQHSLWYFTIKYEEGHKTKQRSCIGFNCPDVGSGVGGLQGWCLWGVSGAAQCLIHRRLQLAPEEALQVSAGTLRQAWVSVWKSSKCLPLSVRNEEKKCEKGPWKNQS